MAANRLRFRDENGCIPINQLPTVEDGQFVLIPYLQNSAMESEKIKFPVTRIKDWECQGRVYTLFFLEPVFEENKMVLELSERVNMEEFEGLLKTQVAS